MEAIHHLSPNVVGFQLATGDHQWYIVGCYIAPNDTTTRYTVVTTLEEQPQGSKILVAVDFNTNILEPEGYRRRGGILETLAMGGFEDMLEHLIPRRR